MANMGWKGVYPKVFGCSRQRLQKERFWRRKELEEEEKNGENICSLLLLPVDLLNGGQPQRRRTCQNSMLFALLPLIRPYCLRPYSINKLVKFLSKTWWKLKQGKHSSLFTKIPPDQTTGSEVPTLSSPVLAGASRHQLGSFARLAIKIAFFSGKNTSLSAIFILNWSHNDCSYIY